MLPVPLPPDAAAELAAAMVMVKHASRPAHMQRRPHGSGLQTRPAGDAAVDGWDRRGYGMTTDTPSMLVP